MRRMEETMIATPHDWQRWLRLVIQRRLVEGKVFTTLLIRLMFDSVALWVSGAAAATSALP